MISYGVGDRASRALVLTLDRLDAMFAHCAVSTSSPPASASLVTVTPKTTTITTTPAPSATTAVHCGLETCTEEVWARMAGGFPCGARIDWLQTAGGGSLTESTACLQIASAHPIECGTCAPAIATTTMTSSAPSESASVHCSVEACTEEVWTRMAGAFPCGDRIDWLQTAGGGSLNESAACHQIASTHPIECGICSPVSAATLTTTPAPSPTTSVRCGVDACTEEVWSRMAGAYPCGGRIDWLQTAEGGSLNASAACFQIASAHPTECGSCAP